MLLASGNDAANTLADMVGGFDAAVAKMNAKAASLGAPDTHAATPSGLDGHAREIFRDAIPRDGSFGLRRFDRSVEKRFNLGKAVGDEGAQLRCRAAPPRGPS